MVTLLTPPIVATIGNDADDTATRFWVRDPVAKCLDGSQAGYYYKPGAAGNKTAVFFLEGGGLCSHEQDCKARANTDLGSSKNWAPSIDLGNILSSDASYNPTFYQAHKVNGEYTRGKTHTLILPQ